MKSIIQIRLKLQILTTFICLLMSVLPGYSQAKLTVKVDEPGVELSPHLYGLFFEDINWGADGGLYAELIQNRSFEYFPVRGELNEKGYQLTPFTAWEKVVVDSAIGDIIVTRVFPLNEVNTNNLEVNIHNNKGFMGVRNTGYEGIPLKAGDNYKFSFYARMEKRAWNQYKDHVLIVKLEDEKGNVLDSCIFNDLTGNWAKYETLFKPNASAEKGSLVIIAHGQSRLQFDMVSLFPEKTFNKRENGLRADLVQSLADLKPAFLRFPGGCIAHGWGMDNIFNWKHTLGDVAKRKPNWNRWGYHQTYGLGYYEYFLLCEDLGATPLPVVPVGVSCTFTHFDCVPMDKIDESIQDALDLVEFANGSANTKWGKIRAEMGHPEPFNLEYICLGNEEGETDEFNERMPLFVDAFKKKYPKLKLIGNSGLSPNVPYYNFMKELGAWSSDEHYYMDPEWFIENQNRFDNWERGKTKVFVGEYASKSNKLFNALAEAIYLTGIERNADLVEMTSYAPLLARYRNTQWELANLIWFDNSHLVKTPNYYVQQLFSINKGDVYLKNKKKSWPNEKLAVSTTYDKTGKEIIIKLVNANPKAEKVSVKLSGVEQISEKGKMIVLSGGKQAENSPDNPNNIIPIESNIECGKSFSLNLAPFSLNILRIKAE